MLWPCFQQAVETSALAEQEAELPVESETANVEVFSTMEAEALTEEERTPMVPDETKLEEETASAEETVAINAETPQEYDETGESPTERNTASPEAKSEEVEIQEVDEAQNTLVHAAPLEITEVIQEITVEQVSLSRTHICVK